MTPTTQWLRVARRGGFALIEVLGALAVGALILLGLSTAMGSSLEDLKGQQAAYYQSQLAAAAASYISANAQTLQAATPTATTIVPVTLAQLKAGQFLPASVAASNAFGQSPCLLVRQPDPAGHPGQFEALLATLGGQKIPDRDLTMAAAQSGAGGGYISSADTSTARGSSWSLNTTPYRGVACAGAGALGGAAADGGHLVSNLYYAGPGQLSTDFLYRNAVPGRPELNRMNVPLRIAGAALVASGSSCLTAAGVAEAGVAIDAATRAVLSCSAAGVWSAPSQWREPVPAFANLPATGNAAGDVRMVTALSRAFTYDGVKWVALAVDQNGDLDVAHNLTVGNDAIINRDLDVKRDAKVARDIHAEAGTVYSKRVLASDWIASATVQVWEAYGEGDTCHIPIIGSDDGTGNPIIHNRLGTIVLEDPNRTGGGHQATVLVCAGWGPGASHFARMNHDW